MRCEIKQLPEVGLVVGAGDGLDVAGLSVGDGVGGVEGDVEGERVGPDVGEVVGCGLGSLVAGLSVGEEVTGLSLGDVVGPQNEWTARRTLDIMFLFYLW